ncbi:aminotransferase class IV [Aequorivita marina]|uniref:aminotransferase class IV n=1 Tax=Aequorivita marina TaxID=3073654 RepID=UPI002876F955|nr:aminotransferase class IV [Aequorivita sp. S2608]MDS1299551.1 aminotransferase class IV [Aequorivita sp. S2608]
MINLNGNLLQAEDATVYTDNRGLNYGDAVFETLRISEEKIYFWEDHYSRLTNSMEVLKMEIPSNFSKNFLKAEVLKTIKFAGIAESGVRVKLLVWRKTGGKYTPKTNEIEYVISCEALPTSFYLLNEAPCKVTIYKEHCITSGLISTLKTSNRLINILGGIYAREHEFQNCLLLNENSKLVEALNGNIFLVSGNKIKTPPLTDGCINGILRKQIIAIINEMPSYTLEETSIALVELQEADELFITNIIQGIVPVSKFGDKQYGNKNAKELILKLNVRAKMD